MTEQSAAHQFAHLVPLQTVQKGLLAKLDAFCTQHDIPYFLVAGTALGAVRHGDIIPWDDDIDVGMMRSDYDRFMALAGDRLDEEVFIQTHLTDPAYPMFIGKLRLDGTNFDEGVFTELGMHQGVFIDIFPFDNIRSKDGLPKHRLMLMALLSLMATSVSRQICRNSRTRGVRTVRWLAYGLRHILPHRAIRRWYERLARTDNARETEHVCAFDMYSLHNYRKTIFARDGLLPPKPGQFGDRSVPLPARTHDYLTAVFGDYMTPPPPDQRVPHHAKTFDLGKYG